jgi:hypothetical protein
MDSVYAELCEARKAIDKGRRILWRVCERAGFNLVDRIESVDPMLHEALEQLDEACGATCPRA